MKRKSGRCMALALALVMILSLFPVGALAEGDESLPVRFICDETTAQVTVYDAGGQPVDVGTDGVHHLTPGTYYYSAEAEGYESTGMQAFTVPADAVGDQELRLSLTPAAGGDQAADPQMLDPLKEADPNAPTEEEAEDDGKLRIYPADGSFHLTIDGQYTTAAAVPAELQELVAGKDKAGKQPAAAEQTPAPADETSQVPGATPGEVPAAAPLDAAGGIPALNPAENPLGVPVENAANGTETGNTAVPPSAEPAENTAALKKGLYLKQPAAEELYLDRLTLEKALGFYVADWTIVNLVDEESERKEMTGSYNVTVSGPAMDKYRDYEPVFALMTLHWDEEGNIVDRDLSIIETTHTPTKSSWSFMTDKLSTLLIAVPTSMPYVDETEKEFKLTAQTLSTEDGRVTVSGMLPKGATLSVVEVPFETAAELYASSTGNDATAESVLFAYDISILYHGQKYQPEDFDEKVRVTINDTNTEDKINVLHVKTDLMNIEITPEETALPAEGEAVPEAAAAPETPAEPATPESELLPAETVDGAIAFDMSSFSIVIGIHGTKLSANVQALSKIIIDDQMYTTLLDKDLKVVSTNDPEVEQDIKYKSKEDGGQGATIDRTGENSKLTVRFRMAAIAPHDGSNGVQEGVAYSLALPQSADANGNPVSTVLPAEVDANGTKIVNPDEAVEFFQLEGGLRAFGEITGADPDYTLYICFEDVEDWLDISGTFQYEGTVNEALEPGKTYNLDYVPGGTVSFTVTPEEPPEPEQKYKLTVSGIAETTDETGANRTAPNTIKWTVTVEDDSEKPIMPAAPLVVTLHDGSAVGVNWSSNQLMMQGMEVNIYYKDNPDPVKLTPSQSNACAFSFIDDSGNVIGSMYAPNDETVVNFNSYLYLAKTMRFDFGVLKSHSQGRYNGTDPADPIDQNIEKYEIIFRSYVYDHYDKIGDAGYYATATLEGLATDGGNLSETNKEPVVMNFGSFGSLSFDDEWPEDTWPNNGYLDRDPDVYEYRKPRVESEFNTGTSGYSGNYYWFRFDPKISSSGLDANYYLGNGSFVESNMLEGYWGGLYKPAFSELSIGSATKERDWIMICPISKNDIDNFSIIGTMQSGGYGRNGSDNSIDVLIDAYQMKQVTSSSNGGNYVLHVSKNKVNGRYIYLLVDSATYETARGNRSNGWGWMSSMGKSSNTHRPEGFKIHVFGAPSSSAEGKFTQRIGALINGNVSSGGSNTDGFYTGNGLSGPQATRYDSYGDGYKPATVMTGTWVSENLIFWEFVFDAKNLPNDRDFSFYMRPESSCYPGSGQAVVDGQTLYADKMYVKSGSNWMQLDGTWRSTSYGYAGIDDNVNAVTNHLSTSNLYVYSSNNYYIKLACIRDAYRDGNNDIHLGFFTTNLSSYSNYYIQAELVPVLFDFMSTGSGSSAYPIKLYSSSTISHPTVTKKASRPYNTNDNDGNAMTAVDWTITPSISSSISSVYDTTVVTNQYNGYYGGFSGRLVITDTMWNSSATHTSVNPAKYTTITQMAPNGFVIQGPGYPVYGEATGTLSCGPIPTKDKPGDSAWEMKSGSGWVPAVWDPENPGVYQRVLKDGDDPAKIEVYYSGNMYDSIESAGIAPSNLGMAERNRPLHIVFTGLKLTTFIRPFMYRTEFDTAAFARAALAEGTLAPDQAWDVQLSNYASTSMQTIGGPSPSPETVNFKVAAALAITKNAGTVPNSDPESGVYNDAYTASLYKITTELGYSPSEYLIVEDFIQGYKELKYSKGEDGNFIKNIIHEETSAEACNALAENLTVSNLVISWIDPSSQNKEQVPIMQNGTVVDPWVITPEAPEKNGALFRYRITRSDGKVPAESQFIITYDMTVDMDKPFVGANGQPILEPDGLPATFRTSEYYNGGTLDINNNAMSIRTFESITPGPSGIAYTGKQLTVRPLVSYSKVEGPSLMASQIRPDGTLMVDADTGVNAEYLIETPGPIKEPLVSDENGHSEWLFYEWTGTAGKPRLVPVSLTDTLRLTFSDVTYTKDGQTVEGSKNDLIELEYIAEKHATYSEINVYQSTHTTTPPSKDEPGTQLWAPNFSFSGTDGPKSDSTTTSSGINLALSSFPATFSPGTDDTEASHGHTGFTLTAESLPYSSFLSVTYDLDIDWDAFYEEAKVKFPDLKFQVNRTNTVIDQNGRESSSSGDKIEIQDTAIFKEIKDSTPKDGKATWQVTASIGQKENGATLQIRDEVKVAIDTEERVKAAAQAATSIDPDSVKVVLETAKGQTTIYQKGEITGGWTDGNISVIAEGTALSVLIQDLENSVVLGNNQTYSVTYDTVLDKDKFIQNGGKAGDSYTLNNSADMNYGSSYRTAGTETEPTPDIPVTAKKVANKNPADYIASWTAEAGTGEAARKEFTLTDQVGTQDPLAMDFLSISSFNVTVKDEEGTTTNFNHSTLPEGVTLTDEEGNDFALNAKGHTGFILKFEELAKGTTVTVDYQTTLDRDAYTEAGGEPNAKISLKNMLHVSSADGYGADSPGEAELINRDLLDKSGKIVSATSSNGNPIVEWTVPVNLNSQYSNEELAEMETVTVTDNLMSMLKYVNGSVRCKDLDTNANLTPTVETSGQTVKFTLNNPAEHPNFQLTFRTECLASVDALSNSVDLSLDGETVTETETKVEEPIKAAGIYGTIRAVKAPEYTPTAWKYLEGQILTTADAYSFQITETDENWKAIRGGYTETVKNNAEGQIPFSTIQYSEAGTHYYTIVELGADAEDQRVFKIQADVVHPGSEYYVEETVIEPQNYENVRFDNTKGSKTTSISVTKVWDDHNRSGSRPSHITVYLYQAGKPYNNMSATLSDSNGWSYTWEDLPIAGGEYSVVEKYVVGYVASYHVDGNTTTIVNYRGLPQTGQNWWPVILLSVSGTVVLAAGLILLMNSRRGKKRRV